MIKNPKNYFFDTGLRNVLLDQFLSLRERTDAGALVENSVFVGLRHSFPPPSLIRFWRSKNGAEVDFIFEKEGEPLPLEVKYSADPFISRSLKNFLEIYQPKQAFIATRGVYKITKLQQTKIKFIPAWYWC